MLRHTTAVLIARSAALRLTTTHRSTHLDVARLMDVHKKAHPRAETVK